MQTPMNRKSATRLLLVQWSKFQNVSVKLEGSTLFTGINGSGKSTILDAVTYLITGWRCISWKNRRCTWCAD